MATERHISWNEEIQGIEVKTFFLLQDNSSQYSLDNYRDGVFWRSGWQHVWIIILVVITALAGGSIAA